MFQENPKKSGTKSYEAYEKYKGVKTYQEFVDLGGRSDQILYDYRKGFLHIGNGDIQNFTQPEKKPKEEKKTKGEKKKKEKKPKTEKNQRKKRK